MKDNAAGDRRERMLRGEAVDLWPDPGKRIDAADGLKWNSCRTVEASTLLDLVTAPIGSDQWSHRPIRLAGARVLGHLDLEAAILTRPLYLADCFIENRSC
ncbi:hypothetical protein [Actinoplanes aureus]|uniref:Uncharacterized protein n=1 Tax=Actinoplanes aureus TaxID=2792083 RepID=A0A931G0B1_9ACTN|nr:hypothetical protein [Actinoplanes aureus]MBG0566578.1 hypothetical protein [Actinoplanes aureus]